MSSENNQLFQRRYMQANTKLDTAGKSFILLPQPVQSVLSLIKISKTGWFEQQTLISHSLEAGKCKIKALTHSVSGGSPLPGSQMVSSPVSSHGGRGEGALWGLFYQGTNPIMGAPSSGLNYQYLPQGPNTIILDVRVLTYEF